MAEGNIQYLNVPGKAAREAKHDEEPDPVSRNRPVEFTLALVEMICDRITSGERLSRICAEKDMPAAGTFYKWLRHSPEAAEIYEQAKAARAECTLDQIVVVNEQVAAGILAPQEAKLISENVRFLAKAHSPKPNDKPELTGKARSAADPDKPMDNLEIARYLAYVWGLAALDIEQGKVNADELTAKPPNEFGIYAPGEFRGYLARRAGLC